MKLKSPPPLAFNSSRSRNQAVSAAGLTANSRVSYDPKSSIVSFLSGDVDLVVDELHAEWDRVQKTLAIARHISNISRMEGFEEVKLLSFNLLSVEFSYHAVSSSLSSAHLDDCLLMICCHNRTTLSSSNTFPLC